MKKSTRLNQELIYLQHKHKFNLSDLTEEFNISKRTALRDISELEYMGLALQVAYGSSGGYTILKNRLLAPFYFNSEEIDAIFFALHAIKPLSITPFNASYSHIYTKLMANVSDDKYRYLDKIMSSVSFYTSYPLIVNDNLSLILQAIIKNQQLYIQYENKKFWIQPYEIFYRQGIWFCGIFILSQNTFHVYRCELLNIIESKDSLIDAENLKQEKLVYEKLINNIKFTCLLTSFGKELFLKKHYPHMSLKEENDKIYLVGSFNLKELNYLVHYMTGFGKHIKILEPTQLKQSYIEYMTDILNQYD